MKKQLMIFAAGIMSGLLLSGGSVMADELEVKAASGQQEAVVSTDREYLPVLTAADEACSMSGKVYDKNLVSVIEEGEDWCLISSGSVFGYIPTDCLSIGDDEALAKALITYATICGDQVRIHEAPELESEVIRTASEGQCFLAEEDSDAEWVALSCQDEIGYVSSDYVELSCGYSYGETLQEEKLRLEAETEQGGDAVVAFARQFIGNPYVWGGTSLTNGADCSGFVMAVYENFGVSLPHSSSAMRSCGYAVSYEEARPGDIICYSGHVAIYAGDDRIVHAFNSRDGIVESSALYKSIICVRRIF